MADTSAPRHGLIVSLHVPKTAGTYLGGLLKQRYGEACALYYGEGERTHPLIRKRPRDLRAEDFDALAESGVKIVHGHLRARYVADFIPDPASYWVILREPIEQTISHYYYQQTIPNESRIGRIIKDRGLSVAEFTEINEVKNYQASFVKPFALEDMGFVGVTELMAEMLPLLGLKDASVRSNENRQKPMADLETRQKLAADLTLDFALYSQAMEMAMRRIGGRQEAATYKLRRRLGQIVQRARLSGAR